MSKKSIPQFLFNTLAWKRGSSSKGEDLYVEKCLIPYLSFLAKKQNAEVLQDDFGNLFVQVGEHNSILFTAHTDTVEHADVGRNILEIDRKNTTVSVKGGGILGADDGGGLYILTEMIKQGVRGTYAFFREEEWGGLGSKYYVDNFKDEASSFNLVVSFDRKGTDDVIISQCYEQTASETLVEELEESLMFNFTLGDRDGIFTDSYSFIDVVPECTNISIGYEDAHSKKENLNYGFLKTLAKMCCWSVQWENLTLDLGMIEKREDGLFGGKQEIQGRGYGFNYIEGDEFWSDYWKGVDDSKMLEDKGVYCDGNGEMVDNFDLCNGRCESCEEISCSFHPVYCGDVHESDFLNKDMESFVEE